jgi:hypothetical protein
MKLPEWTETGLLPLGVHPVDLPGLYERLVLDAPNRERRELLLGALSTHLKLAQAIIPAGQIWIAGSFCAQGLKPPQDVDIVIKPTDISALDIASPDVKMRLYGLLTLKQVDVKDPPAYLSKLQPVGGAVDAYLCRPGQEARWQRLWSSILDKTHNVVTGMDKGFAEVTW